MTVAANSAAKYYNEAASFDSTAMNDCRFHRAEVHKVGALS